MSTKVGVFGAGGKMGLEVCRAVSADPDLELVEAVDPTLAGESVAVHAGIPTEVLGDLRFVATHSEVSTTGLQVAVDFTRAEAVLPNARWCSSNGVHMVIGTTGMSVADIGEMEAAFSGDGPNCIIAANFAIGAVLMMRFAEMAAPWFDSAEIIELHHDAKADAPSGTAVKTAERMAAASDSWTPDPTVSQVIPGARGALGPGGIHVHSVRMRGLVAHQEVLFGSAGQSLSIRHDSYDRTSFMPGVVLAVKAVAERPGLTVGLEKVLGL